jgi:hypothetical protein
MLRQFRIALRFPSFVAIVLALTVQAADAQDLLAVSSFGVQLASPVEAANGTFRRAERLASESRVQEARVEYLRAIDELRAQKVVPAHSMWQLAQIEYGYGNPMAAARILSDLSREAEAGKAHDVRATALVGAIWIYGSVGMNDSVRHYARELAQVRRQAPLGREVMALIDQLVVRRA